MQDYGAPCCLGLRMRKIWLGGVTDDDADDTLRLILASVIENDVVTYFAHDSLYCAGRA